MIGNFHRIFSDDQEKSITKFINDNYIEPGNYFSDKNFEMVIFDFYDDFLNLNDQNLKAHLILFQILNQGI